MSTRVSSSAGALTLVSAKSGIESEAGFRNGGWERPHEAEGPGPGTHKAQSAVRRLRSRATDNTHFLLVSFFKTLSVDTIVCVFRQIYVWSCNFMCSALKEICHFTIKYNFIVNSICPKRTLLSLQTFYPVILKNTILLVTKCKSLCDLTLKTTSSSVPAQLLCLAHPVSFLPFWPISLG